MIFLIIADIVLLSGNNAGSDSRPHQRRTNDLQHLVLLQHTGANDVVVC